MADLTQVPVTPTGEQHIAKVEVDRELCIGAASCVAIAPEAFQLDGENKAVPQPAWRKLSDAQLLDAAKSCPVLAIYLTDKNGKRIYPE